jgi:hypothetical protein
MPTPSRRARWPVLASGLCAALALAGCTDLNTPVAPERVLQLTISQPSLPADGFSTAQVTAQIDPATSERYRDIIFTTTLGSFPSGTSTQARSIVVTANSDGRAVTSLRSASQTGTATVTAEIRDGSNVKASQSATIDFQAVPPSEVLTIELVSEEAPADGAWVTPIVAQIARSIPPDLRDVTFTTTAGSLSIGTSGGASTVQVRAGTDNRATVNLVSPRTVGTALITAAVSNISVRKVVEFTQAYPDRAALSISGTFRLLATFATKASLRLELFRDVGTVTRGTLVEWSATDDTTGSPVGYFSGVTPSDLSGVCTADFTPGATAERGTTTIRARVVGSNVTAALVVEIVDPPK